MIAIVITGAPGAGKSTVAAALASRLDRGAHVPVDFFRKDVAALIARGLGLAIRD